MTTTLTPNDNNAFVTVGTITRENLDELTSKLITAFLDTLFLLRKRSMESEDANNLESKLMSYLTDLVIRDSGTAEYEKMATEISSSPTLRWAFNRMISSIRAVSFDPMLTDRFIVRNYDYFTISNINNDYTVHPVNLFELINKYQFVKVIALFESLNIFQEIEFRRVIEMPGDS